MLSKLNALCAELSGWLLSVLTCLLFLDLALRGFGVSVLSLSAMALFVMVAVVYLGLGHCEEMRGHVRVEFGIGLFPEKWRGYVDLSAHLIGCVTVGVTAYAMIVNFLNSFTHREALADLVRLPIYPVKFIMAAALVVYFLQLCLNTYLLWRSVRTHGAGKGNA